MTINKLTRRLSALLPVLSLSILCGNNVAAQEQEIEEIIVTANKSGALTVQQLPNAVKVLSSSELSERRAIDFIDVIGTFPSVQFQDLGPGDKEYIIRGANSSGPSTVAVYFDESPITGSNAQDGGGRNTDIKLIDIERIEVLNGPQGTQYGANALSGLIRYVPNKPKTDRYEGFVTIDYANTKEGNSSNAFSAAVNAPLIEDQLAVRAVGWLVNNTGWVDQLRAAGGPAIISMRKRPEELGLS